VFISKKRVKNVPGGCPGTGRSLRAKAQSADAVFSGNFRTFKHILSDLK
jgi:hypothetical protein